MVFCCRGENCKSSFSTKSNRNKHEKKKGHGPEPTPKPIIECVGDLFVCPNDECSTSSKYKANIVKHLKSCERLMKKRKGDNKKCPFCGKVFAQKSNRDRHVQNTHNEMVDNESDHSDTGDSEVSEINEIPSMVFDPIPGPSSPITEPSSNTFAMEIDQHEPIEESVLVDPVVDNDTEQLSSANPLSIVVINEKIENKRKQSRLEKTLSNIKQQLDYSMNVSESVVEKLKRDFKDNKNEALNYIHECFGDMLGDEGFIRWLAKGVGYKPNRLSQILKENRPNMRNTKFTNEIYQQIYDFWIENSINSNESAYNIKRISKRNFLKQFPNINDPNLIEKSVKLKSGSKSVFESPRMIYTESIRKLRLLFNEKHTPVSLTLFFRYKPYYCVRPTEKEKSSCLCIDCFNPHLYLQSINIYRKSKALPSHGSLTEYINRINSGEDFAELNDKKLCKFYYYQRVVESYIGKEGKPVEYTRTARVDDQKPVCHIVNLIKDGSIKYLKHRTYVDNCSNVFPLMKDTYTGKFIELDFSQNLALRPKHEVQSAHFSNRQYTLHCAIVTPFEKKYHYHLSDDTKHDAVFVDHVLRDLIAEYSIHDEDLWIQSDNAPNQYKSKNSFGLLQALADEFNLRIIRTYGAAGHGKGAIDAMSSFGVKNILRKDIVTYDVFFNNADAMVDYLKSKNPQYYYEIISAKNVVLERQRKSAQPIEIPGCMKQHLMIYKPNEPIFCKEYLCDCTSCLQFDFEKCLSETVDDVDDNVELDFEEEDCEVDQTDQLFDFITVPSFITLYTGSTIEPLYFVQLTGKGISEKDLSDPYGHFIAKGDKYFEGLYLKLCRSRNANVKRFSTLPTKIVISPDEIYDSYVEFNDELELDTNIYNSLNQKASS